MLQAKVFNVVFGMCAISIYFIGIAEKKPNFVIGGLVLFLVTFVFYISSKVYY